MSPEILAALWPKAWAEAARADGWSINAIAGVMALKPYGYYRTGVKHVVVTMMFDQHPMYIQALNIEEHLFPGTLDTLIGSINHEFATSQTPNT